MRGSKRSPFLHASSVTCAEAATLAESECHEDAGVLEVRDRTILRGARDAHRRSNDVRWSQDGIGCSRPGDAHQRASKFCRDLRSLDLLVVWICRMVREVTSRDRCSGSALGRRHHRRAARCPAVSLIQSLTSAPYSTLARSRRAAAYPAIAVTPEHLLLLAPGEHEHLLAARPAPREDQAGRPGRRLPGRETGSPAAPGLRRRGRAASFRRRRRPRSGRWRRSGRRCRWNVGRRQIFAVRPLIRASAAGCGVGRGLWFFTFIYGVTKVFPVIPHGYCMRHLEENFKKFKHPDLTKLLWTAARAITQEEYDTALENVTKINGQAVPWLLEHAKRKYWAELYFSGRRYGHLTSNIAESFNSCILEAREKPILPMLETIRHHLMDWYTDRPRSESTTQGLLVKNVANSIQKLANDRARRYRFHTNILDVSYEVQSTETLKEYRVNLASRTCSCRAWQSTGYPCSHALAIIITRKENPQQYAESFYSLNSFRQTYATPTMHPHNNENVNTLIGPLLMNLTPSLIPKQGLLKTLTPTQS